MIAVDNEVDFTDGRHRIGAVAKVEVAR